VTDPASVLLVEDNPVTRKMVRIALEAEGYAVIEAADGRAAVAAAQREMPDLVLQDLVLPDVSGLHLVGQLRALPGGDTVPIVAMSGFTTQIEEARFAEAGFTARLIKPVEPSRLVETVGGYLPKPRVATPVSQGRRVLLIDDDPVQLKLARIQLRELGFNVNGAASAVEGLRMAHNHPPDVIVSDVLMPEVDGFQLCFEVRRSPKLAHVPVLLLSAHYQTDADRALAGRVGASGLVQRTDGPEHLAAAIARAIGEGAAPPSEEPSDAVKLAHARAVIAQLERQAAVTDGLSRRCALQAAQISLLGGIADALARRSDFELALRDVLAATLDAAAISKGALLLVGADRRTPLVRQAIGFSEAERAALPAFFGHLPLLEQIIAGRMAVSVPSRAVPEEVAEALLRRTDAAFLEIVPLVSEGAGVGAIVLAGRRTDVTTEDAVAFARAIGNQIVKSLELEFFFRRLAESEQRYRALMESAGDVISILTTDGVIREANRRLAETLGMPRERLIGHRMHDFVPAYRGADAVEIRRPDGTVGQVQFSNTVVDVGEERLVFSIGRDVTEQVRAHAQLMMSDRMASLGMLAAGVAHEINNPLSAVTGNLELATRELEAVAESLGPSPWLSNLEDEIRDARDAAERVRFIVRDLKLFSRAEEHRRAPVDVNSVLESSLRVAWNEIRHRARIVKDYGQIPLVQANESRVGQVFLNLIVNAAQAIAEGHADENEIRIRTAASGGDHDAGVVVEIADTGAGMEPAALSKLFTPFFTTKPQGVGTGLGLTICHRIITGLGGDIAVSSERGKGTTFRVTIPCGDVEANEAPSAPSFVSAARRKGRILIIDDEDVVARTIARMLAPEHEVHVLTSAAEALARITGGERFDVILCDVMMPVMTGLELYQKLTSLDPDQAARVVFLTGGAFTAEARAFLDEIPNARIEKPFERQALRVLVNARLV